MDVTREISGDTHKYIVKFDTVTDKQLEDFKAAMLYLSMTTDMGCDTFASNPLNEWYNDYAACLPEMWGYAYEQWVTGKVDLHADPSILPYGPLFDNSKLFIED